MLIISLDLIKAAAGWCGTVADFLAADKKIFSCRLVCGEFKQVCDKIGACACRAISDSARSQNVLSDLVG